MSTGRSQEFGKFRSLFFPVHKNELKLFLPLVLIFFFICFNYNILRAAKDSLVITAPSSGAEIIPFIKVWAILPMALLITLIFTRLANRFTMEKVFYIMLGSFLGFFTLFTTLLYPMRDILHPHEFADYLQSILPAGCKGMIALIRNWTFTAFYVMAEMWSTMIMTVLFWGFANEILNVNIAKRFYVLILIGGNLSSVCAGSISASFSDIGYQWSLSSGMDAWQGSLLLLTSLLLVSGGIIIGILRWLHLNTLSHESFKHLSETHEKPKMSLRKNFRYLAQSKYLLCIAAIVIMYNVSINLTEVTWKDQLVRICPNPNEFNAYMGKVLIWSGILATSIAVLYNMLLRRLNWTFNAMITPVILLITGALFVSFIVCKDTAFGISFATFMGMTPTALGVLFGSIQHCFTRASKYTLFDATKELAFVPLSKESKLKGKAAIDGIGSRLGKSGSSLSYQVLLMAFGTVSATVPFVGCILFFALGTWLVAVYFLGKQFHAITAQREPADIPEEIQQATT